MPLFGPPNVAKMLAKQDYHGLMKAVNFKGNSEVRLAASKALQHRSWPLASEHEAAIVQLTLAAMNDTDKQVRLSAIETLGDLPGVKNELVLKNLSRILDSHSDSQIQMAVMIASADCAIRYYYDYRGDYPRAITVLSGFGKAVADPLIAKLTDKENIKGTTKERQIQAIVAILAEIGAVGQLKDLVLSSTEAIIPGIIDGLAKIGNDEARELLADILQNNTHYQDKAALALLELGDLDHLKEFVLNPPAEMILNVIDGLAKIGNHEAKDLLANILRKKTPHQDEAALALGKLGDLRSVTHLVAMFYREWGKRRDGKMHTVGTNYRAITDTLSRIKDPRAIKPLLNTYIIEDVFTDMSRVIESAILQAGNTCVIPQLITWFESKDETIDQQINRASDLFRDMLTRNADKIDIEDLRAATRLKELERTVRRREPDMFDPGDGKSYVVKIRLIDNELRHLALQELARRGLSLEG